MFLILSIPIEKMFQDKVNLEKQLEFFHLFFVLFQNLNSKLIN